MTSRGAKTVGENVYLWENKNGSFEYVPSIGALSGNAVITRSTGNYWNYASGNNGDNAIGRQTGGGGSLIIN